MTREEARAAALAKPRLKMLSDVRADLAGREWTGIDVLFAGGARCGVGNPAALKAVKAALLAELDRQMAEASAGG